MDPEIKRYVDEYGTGNVARVEDKNDPNFGKVYIKQEGKWVPAPPPPEIRAEPSFGRQVGARAAEGVLNILGMPGNLLQNVLPEGIAPPTSGQISDLFYGPGKGPYDVPRGSGWRGTVAEGIRGATEDITFAPFTFGAGNIMRAAPMEAARKVAVGSVPSALGAATGAIAGQHGASSGAQVATEIGATLGFASPVPVKRGIGGWLRNKGILPPEAEKTTREVYARGKAETEAGLREVAPGVAPEAPTAKAARIQETIPEIENIPTFMLYPQLKEYVPFLQRDKKLWEELLQDQGHRTGAILRRIKSLADENLGAAIGEDAAAAQNIKALIGEDFQTRVSQLTRAIEDANTSTIRIRETLGEKMPESASNDLRTILINMEHESRLQAGDYYVENVPKNLRRSDVIDMTPLMEARDNVLPTTVSGRRKVPWGAVRDVGEIHRNAQKLADEAAESAELLRQSGFGDRLPKAQQEMLNELITERLERKPLTNLDELIDLRSYILEMKRGLELRFPEKQGLVAKLETLRRGIDEGIFDKMMNDASNESELVQKMRIANEQYKAYREQFHKGVGAELFRRNRTTGALTVGASATIGRLIKTPEGADGLRRLFAGQEEKLDEYVSQWFGGTMRRGLMLEGTPTSLNKFQKFLGEHEAALERFPELKQNLNDLFAAQKELAEKGPVLVKLQEEFDNKAVYLFHGQEPATTFSEITSIADKNKRQTALNEILKYGEGGEIVKRAFARAYYRDMWGIPIDAVTDPKSLQQYVDRLKDIDVKAVREKFADRRMELQRLFGDKFDEMARSTTNILDAVEMAQKGAVGPSKAEGLEEGYKYLEKFTNQVLQRVWWTQIGRVSPQYPIIERAVAWMTKGARERGINQLAESVGLMLLHPEVAEGMLRGTEAKRFERLNAFYRGNVLGEVSAEKEDQNK